MYNYFMIMGNVKSVEDNILTITSTREFPELDGTRKIDEFKFELRGALADETFTKELEEGMPLGVKGRLEPFGNSCKAIAERFIFTRDLRTFNAND